MRIPLCEHRAHHLTKRTGTFPKLGHPHRSLRNIKLFSPGSPHILRQMPGRPDCPEIVGFQHIPRNRHILGGIAPKGLGLRWRIRCLRGTCNCQSQKVSMQPVCVVPCWGNLRTLRFLFINIQISANFFLFASSCNLAHQVLDRPNIESIKEPFVKFPVTTRDKSIRWHNLSWVPLASWLASYS